MDLKVLLAFPFLIAAFAGCIGTSENTDSPAKCSEALMAGPPLYKDPQNTPHPAYNWPTVAYPAVGCDVPALWKPIPAASVPDAISALTHVTQTANLSSGAGIALFGSIAVVPGFGSPTAFVDISDPTNPVILSTIQPTDPETGNGLSHRGAVIVAYPTGRLVTVVSTGSLLDVWDITDPSNPVQLPPMRPATGSHKVGVVPGTPIIYNAASDGGNGGILPLPGPGNVDPAQATGLMEMYDLSDPENAIELPAFKNGYSCHHVYFWNDVNATKFRGICAGIEYTQIFDTTDPKNPEIVVSVPYGHGFAGTPSGSASIAAFSHYAGLSMDGNILLVGDESGGGLGPIGCTARVDTTEGALSPPNGAVWFYDVSDETNPVLKGWISASQLEKMGADGIANSCTAHHGRMIPVPDGDVLAMSFYGAGVIVIDYSDVRQEPAGLPRVLAQYADNSNTWETWYYNGYLFTGDLARGMDVLTLA